jgi:hypothetical protein
MRLIRYVVPRRVGYAKYEVDITWTPVGAALVRLAVLADIPDVVRVAERPRAPRLSPRITEHHVRKLTASDSLREGDGH